MLLHHFISNLSNQTRVKSSKSVQKAFNPNLQHLFESESIIIQKVQCPTHNTAYTTCLLCKSSCAKDGPINLLRQHIPTHVSLRNVGLTRRQWFTAQSLTSSSVLTENTDEPSALESSPYIKENSCDTRGAKQTTTHQSLSGSMVDPFPFPLSRYHTREELDAATLQDIRCDYCRTLLLGIYIPHRMGLLVWRNGVHCYRTARNVNKI